MQHVYYTTSFAATSFLFGNFMVGMWVVSSHSRKWVCVGYTTHVRVAERLPVGGKIGHICIIFQVISISLILQFYLELYALFEKDFNS